MQSSDAGREGITSGSDRLREPQVGVGTWVSKQAQQQGPEAPAPKWVGN